MPCILALSSRFSRYARTSARKMSPETTPVTPRWARGSSASRTLTSYSWFEGFSGSRTRCSGRSSASACRSSSSSGTPCTPTRLSGVTVVSRASTSYRPVFSASCRASALSLPPLHETTTFSILR